MFVLYAAYGLGTTAVESMLLVVNHQSPPMGSFSVIPASLLLSKDDSTFSFMKSQYMALGVSVFSMLMKEQLFQVTAKIAKRIDSQVLSYIPLKVNI
jgi:divalent metal cation (Fe/Co/Zn/Cd) transporter